MKVRVQPGDDKGVGHYRILYPQRAVQALGVEVERGERGLVEQKVNPRTGQRAFAPGSTLDADVIVFQRLSNRLVTEMIPFFQAAGHAVVVDVDDDLHAIHHGNRARGGEDAHNVLRACSLADLVTVSTPALARRYAPHGRVAVLPNCVPERLLDMPRSSDGRTVGWAGWTGTHPDDLQMTYGGVETALQQEGARFRQIGPADGVRDALSLKAEPDATGPLALDDYYTELGSLDVGICPLKGNAFNAAKSALKPLEMTARGAAVVMSPRPDYMRVFEDGVGVLAQDRSRSWRTQVARLLRNHHERAELVLRGQIAIRERHTYEARAERWADAWQQAIRNHRADGPRRSTERKLVAA